MCIYVIIIMVMIIIINLVSSVVHLSFYFADLIFVVCQSTAKSAKIGSLESFRLYSNNIIQTILLLLYKTCTLYSHKINYMRNNIKNLLILCIIHNNYYHYYIYIYSLKQL